LSLFRRDREGTLFATPTMGKIRRTIRHAIVIASQASRNPTKVVLHNVLSIAAFSSTERRPRCVNIPHGLTPGGLRLNHEPRLLIRHDWLVDRQPTSITFSNAGMVLGRDITGRIEVGMQFKATSTTHKPTPGTAVGAGGMPTAATRLRGMSRIDRNHRTTLFLGFVRDKGFQLRERPRVHTAAGFGFPPHFRALPNIGQVLQDDRCAWRCRLHNLFTQHVIAVPTKARLFSAHPFQMPLGRLRALLLQGPIQMKQLAAGSFPSFSNSSTRSEAR
jgi:hypothetical protein